jgi:hypothetical protein
MSTAEIRSMILLSLPYPPLPVMAARIEADDGRIINTSDDAVTTTHNLIAKGMTECMTRDDARANAERRQRQTRVLQTFLYAMATEGFATTNPDRLYEIYCRFSIDHITTYLPRGHPVDFRIPPLSYLIKGDRLHTRLAEYMAAQSVLFEDQPRVSREEYLREEPADLLFTLRARLGHVMTLEERARAEAIESLGAVKEKSSD